MDDYARRVQVQSHNQVAFFTYGLTGINLLLTTLVVLFLGNNLDLVNALLNKFTIIIEGVALLGISFFFQSVAKKSPALGLVLWFITSLLMGVMIAPAVLFASVHAVSLAFFSTIALCGLLTIASFQTHFDMSKLSSQVFWAFLGILIIEVINMLVFKSSGLELVISFIMLALLSIFFMIDTQAIRKYKDSYSPFGIAILIGYQLYIDVINIFLQLLRLFSRNN